MDQNAIALLSRTVADAKAALETSTTSLSERQEVVERAVHDLTTKLTDIQAGMSRKGETSMDAETPEVSHLIKNYGRVGFNDLIHKTRPHKDDHCLRGLQERSDYLYMLTYYKYKAMVQNRQLMANVTFDQVARSLKYFEQFQRETQILQRALSTGAAGAGLEFIPSEFSAELQDRIALALRVAALHRNITMPRSPYTLPVRVAALPMGFKVAERTTDNVMTQANMIPAMTPGTRNVQFTAVGIGALTIFSTEEEEDSIIAILPFARDELVMSLANAIETATINGSVTATHEDNDVATGTPTTDPRTAWDGYRAMAIRPSTDTTLSLATFDQAGLRNLRAKMGKYGVNPDQLAMVTSPSVYLKSFLQLADVTTVDRFGNDAVVKTGQLGMFDGIPVIVSEFVRNDVAATGFNTVGGPNTTSTVNIINHAAMVYGTVRSVQVIEMPLPLTDQVALIAKSRMDFNSLHDVVTQTVSALGIAVVP